VATVKPDTEKKTINGAEILVQALVHQGVKTMFAYPGGCSMPLHQALRKARHELRTILPRHEQGGGFAAQGVSRTTDEVGVCMATSGPGATHLVTTLADAKLDSIPMVAITGQVPQAVIGSDAFQETPMVEISRSITKHHYMITDINDVARVVREAFHIATTGRPGPVLIDIPKDVQLAEIEDNIDYDAPMYPPGYRPELRKTAPEQLKQILAAIKRSKKPILYIGGGVVTSDASDEVIKFAKRTGIPVTMTVMGLGAFPAEEPLCLDMLGMHGTAYANYAVSESDLLIALGVRFDDRVTGKLERFVEHGKIIHVDIDPSEIHKNKEAHIPVVADVKEVLQGLNAMISDDDLPEIKEWQDHVLALKKKYPLTCPDLGNVLSQQYAIQELWNQTKDLDPFVSVGVGQHQMWAAQFYKFNKPKRWLSSSGLGTMGFGLPAAMGVKAAHPDRISIDIEGDGSFLMNVQELATLKCEKLPVKILLVNNQHLGMVVQWEDRFMEGRRAHTYLGPVDKPEWLGDGDGDHYQETYPNFVEIAKGFGLQAKQVRRKEDYPAALAEMIASDEPYLLDVVCSYQEHVLPMIPSGATIDDMILE